MIVNQTLEEINVLKPMIYAFNKIDNLAAKELAVLRKEISFSDFKPNIFISVKDRKNFVTLKRMIKKLDRNPDQIEN